jgi:hypothetical protein
MRQPKQHYDVEITWALCSVLSNRHGGRQPD